jgi:uncharacterized protein involved in cysteine biosynthesis
VAELSGTPGLWLPALVPSVVFAALFVVFGSLAVLVARPWLVTKLPSAASELGRVGVGAAGWGFALLLVAVGWYLALALAPTLSAPALERIVDHVERRAGAPPRQPLGFVRELRSGLSSLAGAACVLVPISFLLWLVSLLIPPASVVTAPLELLLSSLLVAWGLFDYPLTLRGLGFRARLGIVRANLGCVTGFGLAFTALFWLPCLGVALLPVGAIAATRLSCRILAAGGAAANRGAEVPAAPGG